MRFTFTQTQTALACALALGAYCVTAGAEVSNEHLIVTSSSGQPVTSGSGLCVYGGTAAPDTARVDFDNGQTADVATDYNLRAGDRVIMLSNGKVGSPGSAPSWTAGCSSGATPVAQYVAPREAEPVFVAAAAAPFVAAAVYETVSFDANVMFDSNKSDLRSAGRDSLDSFVHKIRGLEAQSVMAIGYADRMGSAESNQILSQQRVDMVKAYLVSQGVAADRVDTNARGERQPTTWLAECKDANNAKNVACMQPDRHVFIEVSGSRLAQ
jgi:outer membrane protein OmpA-like peptidoglycan-associated protein